MEDLRLRVLKLETSTLAITRCCFGLRRRFPPALALLWDLGYKNHSKNDKVGSRASPRFLSNGFYGFSFQEKPQVEFQAPGGRWGFLIQPARKHRRAFLYRPRPCTARQSLDTHRPQSDPFINPRLSQGPSENRYL